MAIYFVARLLIPTLFIPFGIYTGGGPPSCIFKLGVGSYRSLVLSFLIKEDVVLTLYAVLSISHKLDFALL